ncbi:hypothetical protein TKK_0002882 [Trichogramma kaykai]
MSRAKRSKRESGDEDNCELPTTEIMSHKDVKNLSATVSAHHVTLLSMLDSTKTESQEKLQKAINELCDCFNRITCAYYSNLLCNKFTDDCRNALFSACKSIKDTIKALKDHAAPVTGINVSPSHMLSFKAIQRNGCQGHLSLLRTPCVWDGQSGQAIRRSWRNINEPTERVKTVKNFVSEEPLRHLRFEFQPAQQATQSSRPEEKRLRSLQIPRYSSPQQSPKATVFDGIHGVRTSLGLTHESRKQFIWVVPLFVVHVNGLQVLLCSVREAAAQSNGGATVDQVALGAILTPDRFSGGETERRLSEGQSTREIPQIFVPVQTLHHQRKEGTATVSKPLEGSRRANRPGRRSFETQTVEYNSGAQGERRQAVRNLHRRPGSFKFINEQLSQAPSRKSRVGLDSGWQMGLRSIEIKIENDK